MVQYHENGVRYLVCPTDSGTNYEFLVSVFFVVLCSFCTSSFMPHFNFVSRPMYVLYFFIYFMLMDNIVISSIYAFSRYSLLFLIANITFGSNIINKLSAHAC